VRKRKRIPKFLRIGLPISVELDEPAGVLATLRVPSPSGRSQVIARAQPSVAVSGLVGLRLVPIRKAANLLGTDDEIVAKLKVVVTDGAGDRTVLRRSVKLVRD
jgi:hypothetical protein